MQIQKAHPNQAETLTHIALTAKRHWGYPERWIETWAPLLAFSSADLERVDFFVAKVDDEVVGFYSLTAKGPRAELENLWVLPDFMGQGIGRGLFEHALVRARELGCSTLEIEADPHAVGFYEKMGARTVGQHVGEVDGQPRRLPIMEISL
ncbi:MAG: GNAT family N-acetyltransferase [Chloroflexi bacterium]|nr:GNAT family N-acetyltransferase [Chloroflexota bacterium]